MKHYCPTCGQVRPPAPPPMSAAEYREKVLGLEPEPAPEDDGLTEKQRRRLAKVQARNA